MIDNAVFMSCYSLQTINIPNVTSIGQDAFVSCYSLSSINLPALTSLGSGAFRMCSSLENVSEFNTNDVEITITKEIILKKNNQKVFLLLYNNFKLIGLFKNISSITERSGFNVFEKYVK